MMPNVSHEQANHR